MKKVFVLSMVVVVAVFFMVSCVSKKRIKSIESYTKKSAELDAKTVDELAEVKKTVNENNTVMKDGFKNLDAKSDNIGNAIADIKKVTEGKVNIHATVVNCSVLTVREQGTMNSKPLRYLKKGDIVEVVAVDKGWAHLADGGFVSTHYLNFKYKIKL